MVVADLKEALKKYEADELRKIIVDMYKAMPKSLKEEKNIDLLIEDHVSYGNMGKAKKQKAEVANISDLKEQIDLFIEHAYKQYYFAPNNVIHKNERPKWRFKVKAFIKDLQTIPYEGEDGEIATRLLLDLYIMLCYGTGYYIFNTDDPFSSVGIEQEELLVIILKRILSGGVSEKSVYAAIKATVDIRIGSFCIYTLKDCLITPDAKAIAIEQSKKIFKEYSVAVTQSRDSVVSYVRKDRLNALAKLTALLHLDLCENDEAVNYFNENYKEYDPEVSLYIFLNILERYGLADLWVKVYEKAVSKKIKPRDSLKNEYEYIKQHKAFSRQNEDDI